MAFVHRQSCEGVKSELDLFAVPPTQTSIEDGRWIEHQPLTSLDSGGPIEFILPGTGDAYIDLANTYLPNIQTDYYCILVDFISIFVLL